MSQKSTLDKWRSVHSRRRSCPIDPWMLQSLRLVPVCAGWTVMHREACLDVDGETRKKWRSVHSRSFSCSAREQDQGYRCAHWRHA